MLLLVCFIVDSYSNKLFCEYNGGSNGQSSGTIFNACDLWFFFYIYFPLRFRLQILLNKHRQTKMKTIPLQNE